MVTIRSLIERTWRKRNQELLKAYRGLRTLFPELEQSDRGFSMIGPYTFIGFEDRCLRLEQIRADCFKVIAQKQTIKREEFRALKTLEEKTSFLKSVYDYFTYFLLDNDLARKLYWKIIISLHGENERVRDILKDFYLDKSLDSQMLQMFREAEDIIDQAFEDFHLVLDGNPGARRVYSLLLSIARYREFLTALLNQLDDVISDDNHIRSEYDEIQTTLHWLSGEFENEGQFFRTLSNNDKKKKVQTIISQILHGQLKTENDIDRALKRLS